jgi:Zn-dependent protease
MIIFLPPLLAVLYGMAWWKTSSGKASGRFWAIAASTTIILVAIPLTAPLFFVGSEQVGTVFLIFVPVLGPCLALGIGGLVAFWSPSAMAEHAPAFSKARIPGDGTHRILDTAAYLASFVAMYAVSDWFYKQGSAQGLEPVRGLLSWLQFGIVLLISIAVHEAGHALVGRALGMRLTTIRIGPLRWFVEDGHWKLKFEHKGLLAFQGAAGLLPSSPAQSRWDEIAAIAAGPFSNLVLGTLTAYAALTASGAWYEPYWDPLASLASINLVIAVFNLIPLRPQASYSDGARIFQLLRGGPLVSYFRAAKLANSTQVTPTRPRDYDMNALKEASDFFTSGNEAIFLKLALLDHCLDCGDLPAASLALAQAGEIVRQAPAEIHTSWMYCFQFGAAFLHHDAAAARAWWLRIEAAKDARNEIDDSLARCALAWIEGLNTEAMEAWEKGNSLYLKRSPCGSAEYGLYKYGLIRQAIVEDGVHWTTDALGADAPPLPAATLA